MKRIAAFWFPLLAALLFLLLMRHAALSAQAVRAGLQLSFMTAIPALFPFFIAGALLVDSGLASLLGSVLTAPMRRLYGVSGVGAAALLLGLTGGYPVGAQTVCKLYQTRQISATEAERLLGFCNNTGPAFILGVAGIGVCGSARTGMMLYGIHAVSALLVGLLLPHRSLQIGTPPARAVTRLPSMQQFPACFTAAVQQALQTALLVTAFITTASLLLAVLQAIGVFGLLSALFAPLLRLLHLPATLTAVFCSGIVELTCGIMQLPALALRQRFLLPILSFLLAFGGVSVHFQTLALLKPLGLSARLHTRGKLLHGILAALLTRVIYAAMPRALSVFSVSSALVSGDIFPMFCNSACLSLLIVIILLTFNCGKYR